MNTLTLAVAGGRKTQSIVDSCASAKANRSVLVLTYTQRNQDELRNRLAACRPFAAMVEVSGWFGFLLNHCVRPYLPLALPGRRLRGLNFDGDPGLYATDEKRFLDGEGRAYKRHLARLAYITVEASKGAVLNRIARIFDEIWIDEVQDLNGYDLEILSLLMDSPADLRMVGDIRQAILQTNVEERKNKKYKGVNIKQWFDEKVKKGGLKVSHASTTWRCNQEIATFADSIFGGEWGFAPTDSENREDVAHSGIFALAIDDAEAYQRSYEPLCLRHNASSWRDVSLPFVNIGVSKGMGADHVLVAPTAKMAEFVRLGSPLDASAACSLYVAVTRARHSLAFLSDKPEDLGLPVWRQAS